MHRPHRARLRRARRPLRACRAAARRRPRRSGVRAGPPRSRPLPTGDRRWSRTARRSPPTCTTSPMRARAEHPGLPVVLIGHSMGGLIATRYAQRFGDELAALVLSGPAIGGNPAVRAAARDGPDPRVPIDPAVLSRDPAVGEAYAADELVYHGPFQRTTLEQLFAAVGRVAEGPGSATCRRSGSTATDDPIVPLEPTRAGDRARPRRRPPGARLRRRAPRDLQRDQPRRGARRRHRVPAGRTGLTVARGLCGDVGGAQRGALAWRCAWVAVTEGAGVPPACVVISRPGPQRRNSYDARGPRPRAATPFSRLHAWGRKTRPHLGRPRAGACTGAV